jgi:hypothetical protein
MALRELLTVHDLYADARLLTRRDAFWISRAYEVWMPRLELRYPGVLLREQGPGPATDIVQRLSEMQVGRENLSWEVEPDSLGKRLPHVWTAVTGFAASVHLTETLSQEERVELRRPYVGGRIIAEWMTGLPVPIWNVAESLMMGWPADEGPAKLLVAMAPFINDFA